MTIGIPSITPTAAWGLPSTAIMSFLVNSFHFKPKATAKGLVITDIYVPVSNIAKMALLLILV